MKLNGSDSDTDDIPKFSSSEESESESVNESDNESNILIRGPGRRQMLPQLQGFLKVIVNQEYHPS